MGRHSLVEDPPLVIDLVEEAPATAPIHVPARRAATTTPRSAPVIPQPRTGNTHSGELPRVAPEHRLFSRWAETGQPAGLDEHLDRFGPLPRAEFARRRGAEALLELTERAGLRGRGGAGFPLARKMASVVESRNGRRRPVLVANGCEGDPTSRKDRLLMYAAPHLVLDGMALAAHAVGAEQSMLCLGRGSRLLEPLEAAIAERTDDPADVHPVTVPHRYVASEASALVNFLTNGDARPTGPRPLPSERGVQGRPTLVANVETLAHLALIARNGADWFRARGTPESPGTMLVTVAGAVRRAGVHEVDLGAPAGQLLRLAGGTDGPSPAVLLGGLGGGWLPLPAAENLALAHRECAEAGVGLGVASVVALPAEACGVTVTAEIARYLAEESARQCGPCMFGLPAVAEDMRALADGEVDEALAQRLHRRLAVIPRRGACAHPDGSVRLVNSALRVFADDVAEHLSGRPCRRAGATALPLLGSLTSDREDWT
ncbi:hypothetical protein GCM10023321_82690 [Pseudonocardia eucalypti]|uniref:NADH-ubiquinone oxidoreductase 51kDa subunit iron-sulphur binding domain-containing protein n=1 Tax=Pseudonocardia eucalypti TaxID=648755 RepID=A0ABP9RDU2_9PSEU|nr:NADH:ubiquinone oxidoreductase subunit F (NADH-binding) [Pseudonocardia eucalypti]